MSEIIEGAQQGDIISFEVIPSSVLGNNFKHMRVVGQVSAQIAESLGLNAYNLHHQVYALLPEGSAPNNADQYDFIIVETQSSPVQKHAIGRPWITPGSVTVHKSNVVTIKCVNVPNNKIPLIRQALSANGIKITDITVV